METAQEWNLLLSLVVGWLGVVLFLTALIRRYPVRSLFTYALIAVLAVLSVAGAFGAWAIRVWGVDQEFLDNISFAASIIRGAALVLLISLIWYEHASHYRGRKSN